MRVNSSEAVVWALARDRRVSPLISRSAVLPVEFDACFRILKPWLRKEPHDALVCFGQSPYPWIGIERVARNRDITCDGPAKRAVKRVIVPGGPGRIKTRLPIRRIARRLRRCGLKWKYSDDAGGYVCNNLFYHTVRHTRSSRLPCGFIHLPMIGSGGWTRRKLVAAGREIILAVAESQE
jgi:pyroglutamyl-peptidase